MGAKGISWLITCLLLASICLLRAGADEEDTPKEETGPVIGIDLGTTYSCVGIMKKSGVEIIPNDQGNRVTPSYVSFTPRGRLIGEAAKNEAHLQPNNTLYDVKRLIGRRWAESTVQEDIKHMPFEIIDDDGKLKIKVNYKDAETKMVPEEISAMVLSKMKDIAEAFLGEDVKNAVVTVPAYFNNAQREATKDAGKIAGLNVLRILNEPTAAAMAYGLEKKDESNILVYDLGGGTFDVSLLTVADGAIEVLATNGNTHLGGEDFDQRVIDHFVKIFKDKHGKNIEGDTVAMSKLKQECEKAKMTLSSKPETTLEIENLFEGVDFEEKLSRSKFEELNIDLFKDTLGPVKQVLEDGKLTKQEVDEIVFVGGSTRIPKIQNLITGFFNGKKPNQGLNPDEAVAFGASVQGGILSGTAADDVVLLDVTPITLGIETNGGIFDKMVPRNSQLPLKKSKSFQTSGWDTTSTHIRVFEGERPLVKDNNKLGEFTLSGFPKGPPGKNHEITFDIDVNGILTVTAEITDASAESGKKEELTITKDTSRLSSQDIEEMIKNEETYREEDEKALARAKKVVDLQKYIDEVQYKLKQPGASDLDSDEKSKCETAVSEGTSMKNDDSKEEKDIEEKLSDIRSICSPVIAQVKETKNDDDDDDDADEELDDLDLEEEGTTATTTADGDYSREEEL